MQKTFDTNENESTSEIYVWGSNDKGQLGFQVNNQNKHILIPRIQQFTFQIKQIACGEKHTVFLSSEGQIYTLGSNQYGQLGQEQTNLSYTSNPLLVQSLKQMKCIEITCGWNTVIAIFENGEAYSWGQGDSGQLGTGVQQNQSTPQRIFIEKDKNANIVKASSGSRHSAIVTDKGDVYTFGANDNGQLGLGQKQQKIEYTPQLLQNIYNNKYIDVSCGTSHTLLLTVNGQVLSCGSNKLGQLGLGTKKNIKTPQVVKSLEREHVQSIKAAHHSACLTNQGNIYVWGTGSFGEFLIPNNFMQQFNLPMVQFSIGGLNGLSLDINGQLYGWGSNSQGELATGDMNSKNKPCQVQISQLQNALLKQVVLGTNHAFALARDVQFNILNTMGDNTMGETLTNQQLQQQVFQSSINPANSRNFKSNQGINSSIANSSITSPQIQKKLYNNNINTNTNQSISFQNMPLGLQSQGITNQSIESFSKQQQQNNMQISNIPQQIQAQPMYQSYTLKNDNSKINQSLLRNQDFTTQDPTIDIVLSENKYIETSLKFEKEERRRLEKLNLELRVEVKELKDGRGGIKELDEKLQDCIDEIGYLQDKFEQSQQKTKELDQNLLIEQQENKLAKQQIIILQEELDITKKKNQEIEEKLIKKNYELNGIDEEFKNIVDISKRKERNDSQEIEAMKQKIYELANQLQKEQESRRKSESIKNNERQELILKEQEQSELMSQYQDLERKNASAILALENSIEQRKKIEDALQLQNERVQNLEAENTDLMQEVIKLRQAVYENIENNPHTRSIEIDTLLKANKQLTGECKIYKNKYDSIQNDYLNVKQKFNQLLTQLQQQEHKNLQISQFVDFANNISQQHNDFNNNNNNLSQYNSNQNVNNMSYNHNISNQNINPNYNINQQSQMLFDDKKIGELIESANKHAINITKIMRNSSNSQIHKPKSKNNSISNNNSNYNSKNGFYINNTNNEQIQNQQSPNFKQSDFGGQSQIRQRTPEQFNERLQTESDKKLREALELSPKQKGFKKQKNHNRDNDNNLTNLNEIKGKLEKLQKDKQKLEQRLHKYDNNKNILEN